MSCACGAEVEVCLRQISGLQPTSESDLCAWYARLVHVVGVLELQRPEQRVPAGVVAPVGDVDAAHERRQQPHAGAVLPALLRLRVYQDLGRWPEAMTGAQGFIRRAVFFLRTPLQHAAH